MFLFQCNSVSMKLLARVFSRRCLICRKVVIFFARSSLTRTIAAVSGEKGTIVFFSHLNRESNANESLKFGERLVTCNRIIRAWKHVGKKSTLNNKFVHNAQLSFYTYFDNVNR